MTIIWWICVGPRLLQTEKSWNGFVFFFYALSWGEQPLKLHVNMSCLHAVKVLFFPPACHDWHISSCSALPARSLAAPLGGIVSFLIFPSSSLGDFLFPLYFHSQKWFTGILVPCSTQPTSHPSTWKVFETFAIFSVHKGFHLSCQHSSLPGFLF